MNFPQIFKQIFAKIFLGFYGFFNSPISASSDIFEKNPALTDVRAALEWVSKHIDGFGGDPDRVRSNFSIKIFSLNMGIAFIILFIFGFPSPVAVVCKFDEISTIR